MSAGGRCWRKTNVRAACGRTTTCSDPQKYSRTIDFIVAHAAMVSCSAGVSVRGLPSIRGSSRCLTWPSRPLIQPSLQPSSQLPHTTAASMAAMTSVGQVLVVETPSGPARGALEGPVRPEQAGRQDVVDPPGEEMFLGDRHERPGALAEDAGLLGHGQETTIGARAFHPACPVGCPRPLDTGATTGPRKAGTMAESVASVAS